MFNHQPKDEEPSSLEKLIAGHIDKMDGLGPETEEYTAQANNLKTLMECYAIDESVVKPWRPSADTVVTVAGSVIGILAILTFEKANVITSKSLSFVMKPKN